MESSVKMALVPQQEQRVCACWSNRTWLLILATIEIISSGLLIGLTIRELCYLRHPEVQFAIAVQYGKVSVVKGFLIFTAVLASLEICSGLCAIAAECTKRPGILFPWFIMNIAGILGRIILIGECLVYSNNVGFLHLTQLIFNIVAIVITKPRYEITKPRYVRFF